MTGSRSKQILSRLSDDDFVGREAEVAQIRALVSDSSELRPQRLASNALLLGAPRTGKTEILRKSFDRLFDEGGGALPFYYAFQRSNLDPEKFAVDYFSQLLKQFVAFRRGDPGLISASYQSLGGISHAASGEDYLCVRTLVESFARAMQSGDVVSLVRTALSTPAVAAAHAGLRPLAMIDHWSLTGGSELESEFIRALSSGATREAGHTAYVLTGLQRLVCESIPADQEIVDGIDLIRVGSMGGKVLEGFTRRRADLLGIETSDSTIELIVQQLNCDFFYTRAILDAAASRGSSLKTFIDFERIYTSEVLSGRIGHYFDALLREISPDLGERRAALEALAFAVEAGSPAPIDAVTERMGGHAPDSKGLLSRLHSREMLNISYGLVTASDDPVLADYIRAKYRSEISGALRPVAGDEMLKDKVKHSYRLMMSRYNHAIESQLVDLLSRFDFQSVPASLFDNLAYDKHYRGLGRVQVRRALDDEEDRLRLPQVVVVQNAGEGEQPGVTWRLFAATGFEGGIYTEANEVLWVAALINSKEPLDVETLGEIDQQIEASFRSQAARPVSMSSAVRWYISKEGFSAVASERLASLPAYRSTYSHLDLIQDYLTRLERSGHARPASEFELVIPIEEEAELIAARTAEQIARAADFDQEAINQIKTALIEACINAAEHSDSPDRKIHQHFAIAEDKLIITVSNKGKTFGRANGATPALGAQPAKGARGRGLQIIRALMDEVEFERTDDGARLVMTKYLKRPDSQ